MNLQIFLIHFLNYDINWHLLFLYGQNIKEHNQQLLMKKAQLMDYLHKINYILI